tara:strand:- start:255 stop:1088 length:834 start_codon:yes stop_codon:yes gene_type:complete
LINNFYNSKISQLKKSGVKNPELDLKLIITKSSNKKFYILNELNLKDINFNKFNSYFKRRVKGEPISKIFNKKEFWSLNFFVNNNVLDPRPETEFIVETVINHYKNNKKKLAICDIGTGSGCLIISLLKQYKNSIGVGIDISNQAIRIAEKNAIKHKVNDRLDLIFDDWKNLSGKFDVIVSNPPYIKTLDYNNLPSEVRNFDPKVSLLGGNTGFEKFIEISSIINLLMKKESIFVLEIGDKQSEFLIEKFKNKSLCIIEIIRDYNGIKRVLVFKKMA